MEIEIAASIKIKNDENSDLQNRIIRKRIKIKSCSVFSFEQLTEFFKNLIEDEGLQFEYLISLKLTPLCEERVKPTEPNDNLPADKDDIPKEKF